MTAKIKWWQWPNVLSIDAAVISAAWLWVFSKCQHAQVGPQGYLVLSFSVWLTYMADRLFDAAPRDKAQLRSKRHQFAKQYAGLLWSLWAGALVINVLVATTQLFRWQLYQGMALLLICLLYTSLNQLLSKRFFPKELMVAIIFTAGPQVFLHQHESWQAILSFGFLCLANCLTIGWKEKLTDAHLRVRSLSSLLDRRWFIYLIVTSLCLSVFGTCTISLFTSAICLAVLHFNAKHFKEESYRVLCDSVLLIGPMLYALGSGVFVR